jgi:hypothetical protein
MGVFQMLQIHVSFAANMGTRCFNDFGLFSTNIAPMLQKL